MRMIDTYLDEILYGQLKAVNMPYRFIKQIQEDIRCRMLSCLHYWQDREACKAILFVSLEEALFYEPSDAKEGVREFVVTTIRNSMLEIAASDDCRKVKLSEPLSNRQIFEITSEAAAYFNKYDMDTLAKEAEEIRAAENVYTIAMQKYPLAWEILYKAANITGNSMDIDLKYTLESKEDLRKHKDSEFRTVVCNGYTLEFDEGLREAIGEVLAGVACCFYADCFKMVSRNFEKVLHVLQILLENEKVFCTVNYYISCDHIEKRGNILRAAHNGKEVVLNMKQEGMPARIKECIDRMMGEN